VKYWEIIADNLKKAGWSLGYISAIDSEWRTIWIADAHRDNGKRFVVRADEKPTAFLAAGVRDPARCCAYRLLAKNHNVEPALHHRKVEIILHLHGH
jgi:hypothetical protein